jgi:hypothetical protein
VIRSPLKHPVVISGVVLGLLAVALLNLHTFMGEGQLLGRGAERSTADLTPPADLSDVVHQAVRDQAGGPRVAGAAAGSGGGSGLVRDPFSGGTVRPEATVPRVAQPRPQRAPEPKPLVCAAVMLGGEQPLALIDGEARRPGQTVRGYLLLDITTTAVRLQRPDGSVLVLPVGQATSDTSGFHLVTGTVIDAGSGDTGLEVDPDERNDR